MSGSAVGFVNLVFEFPVYEPGTTKQTSRPEQQQTDKLISRQLSALLLSSIDGVIIPEFKANRNKYLGVIRTFS